MKRDSATVDNEHNTEFFPTGQTMSPLTSQKQEDKKEGIFTHKVFSHTFLPLFITIIKAVYAYNFSTPQIW